MKYTLDYKTLPGFIQCISQPANGDAMVSPHIVQFRDRDRVLSRLHRVLKQAQDALMVQEQKYHDDPGAQQAFDYGCSYFAAGDVPVTAVMQRRVVNVFVGSQVAFVNVNDLAQLLSKVAAAEEAQNRDA
jgi:hypothetical protein